MRRLVATGRPCWAHNLRALSPAGELDRKAEFMRAGLLWMPARTHASQGEQRTLALALRLAAHTVVTAAVGEPPVLLLDDVFSELDPVRSEALVAHLPPGQALLTTAANVAPGAPPDLVLRVRRGKLEAA